GFVMEFVVSTEIRPFALALCEECGGSEQADENSHAFTISQARYSLLSTIAGSVDAARLAGIALAASATTTNNTATPLNVTPLRPPARSRTAATACLAHTAIGTPIAIPASANRTAEPAT